jgi:hypothetical protein
VAPELLGGKRDIDYDGGRRTADAHAQRRRSVMSKSQDAKKNVKKAPSKTPKEKKEAKRLKKAGK